MKTKPLLALFLGTLAAACGGSGSSPAPATPSQTTGSESSEGKEHHHHDDASPVLKDFHSVLGPVWHSDAGPTRIDKACTNAKALQDKAKATGDAELMAATAALDPACAEAGRPNVEAKLTTVHERFHALAEKH
jgi:hypothetical protein